MHNLGGKAQLMYLRVQNRKLEVKCKGGEVSAPDIVFIILFNMFNI